MDPFDEPGQDGEREFETLDSPFTDITEALDFTESGLESIERELGYGRGEFLGEAFDRVERTEFERGAGSWTSAAVQMRDGDVTLLYEHDITRETMAHEGVHGKMKQPDGEVDLPGDDLYEQSVYEEFVARIAENLVGTDNVYEEEIERLREDREDYFEKREEADRLGDFTGLYGDLVEIEAMDGEEGDKLYGAIESYQERRENVLAGVAADRYTDRHSVDVKEFIDPDEEVYREAVDFIEEVERELHSDDRFPV
ncbi:MAG: hypothetical protein ABEK01_01195 [Candidatus Nanohaloarchaea archaeon]